VVTTEEEALVVAEEDSSLAGDLATSAVAQEGDAEVLMAGEVIRTTEAEAHKEGVQGQLMENGSNPTPLCRRAHRMRPTSPAVPMRTRPM
jgi:hypothetical protein